MDDQPAQPIPPSLTHIFDLPEEPIVNILSRLDSDHLARSRVVSKAFSDISTKVRSVNLLCSLDRYTNSGQPITPFKEIVTDLILSMGDVDYISIGVEERANHKSLDIKLDDLYLTEVSFVDRWLRRVRGRLTWLLISDYPMHSRRKWSEVLSLISFHCKNLHELVLKNAWLSTKDLSSPMLKLTSLTLAFVRLDDEGLYNVNSCCPSLQILNLIMVEGLKNSQIVNLLHLRTSQFVGSSSAPTAQLPLIHAPNLTRFEVGFGLRIDKIVRCELDLSAEVFQCTNLHELVLKNAWLSTNGLSSAMLMLTSLTLELVRLDDDDLDKVTGCCPSLLILNLILVEGLKKPRINLLHLRKCQYVGSSLATTTPLQVIRWPNLTRFEVGFGPRIDKIVRCELDLGPEVFHCTGRNTSVPNGHGATWCRADLGRPNVFWTAQICLGLGGRFGNFTLKNYPNKSGPSKTSLDGRDRARHHLAPCPPDTEKFLAGTNLHELVPRKNAWLSTGGLSMTMRMLTSLTLAFVRVDDEGLDEVNSCCPSLQILSLIMVEGLKKPRIDLLHLRTFQFVGSSLATTAGLPRLIHAPNLTRFEVGYGPLIDKIVRYELLPPPRFVCKMTT